MRSKTRMHDDAAHASLGGLVALGNRRRSIVEAFGQQHGIAKGNRFGLGVAERGETRRRFIVDMLRIGAVGPHRHRCGQRRCAAQRLLDRQLQLFGLIGSDRFLPVDDAHDEIDGVVVGREGQQDAAIHDRRAAIVDELGLEADRRAVGDDLEIMVGQPRQQRPARHLADMGDRCVERAFLA